MNKVFRVIWSEAQGAWVAVSETTKSHSKRSRKHALALALTAGSLIGLSGQALATGEFVSAGDGSIAINSGSCGTETEAKGEHSVSIGCGAGVNATGPNGIGFADNDTSIGYQAGLNVAGNNNSAIGTNAGEAVKGNNNTAFGVSAGKTITGNKNTSLGDNSGFSIKGDGNLSVGSESGGNVTGDHNVMLGKKATVKGSTAADPISDAVVVGYKASASKSNNVALGFEAKADHENSVALGSLSETRAGESVTEGEISYGTGPDTKTYTYSGFKGTASGVVSVGSAGAERQIINVAPGAITSTSTDAVNGSQLYGVAAGLNKRIDESGGGGWNVVTSNTSLDKSKVAPKAEVDFVSSDKNVAIKHTSDAGNTSIDFALSDDLKIGSKDGTDGKIAVNGKDGVSGVTIDGKDGSIGLTGPAGANGISPTLTMRPDIKLGDVINNTNSITRITYKDADGNDATLATLENDGLRFSGNDNPIDGYVTRLLNKEMQIIGGGQAEDDSGNTIAYSSGNVRTVATQAGGIEIQFAETPNFKGADMGGQQITSVGSGLGGQALTEITGADLNNAVNVGDLQNTTTGLVNTGFNITADKAALTDPSATQDNVKLGETVAYTGEDGNITTTVKDNQIDFALSDDLKIGSKDGTNGKIAVNGKDGSSVVINGADGSIGLTGPAGANGTISVTNGVAGVDGKDGMTRIVIDGNEVATMKDGLNFAGNTGATIAKELNDTLTVKGELADDAEASGANLRVDSDGGQLNLVMAKDLTDINSITINNGGPVISGSGIDMGGLDVDGKPTNKITNLAPGTDGTDAVNVDQLTKVETVANAGWNVATSDDGSTTASKVAPGAQVDFVSSDKNVAIKHTSDAEGNTSIDFALNDDLKIGSKDGTDGKIAVNGKDGSSVVINGADGSIGLTGPTGANGTISVTNGVAGVDGKDGMTRIVIDGNEVATMKDGLKFAGNTGATIAKELNDTLTISGGLAAPATDDPKDANASGANLRVDSDGGQLNLVMAKDLTDINSITINNGGPVISGSGIDMGGKKITNLAPGTEGTDAVNVDQLETVKSTASQGWYLAANGEDETTAHNVKPGEVAEFADGKNIDITRAGNKITVATKDSVTFTQVTTGDSILNNTGLTFNNSNVAITAGGINAGGQQITNVAAGVLDTDGVNFGQLKKYVGDQITNITGGDWELSTGSGADESKVTVGDGGKVSINGNKDGNIDVALGKDPVTGDATGDLTIATKPDVTHESVTTGDTVMNDDGVTITGGPSMTKDGVDAGSEKITNVAKGDISETSTDAVNGSQLKDTNNRVDVNEGHIANNTTNITKNAGDIANNTTNITKNTGDIANNTTNITKNTGDIANNTTNITKNAGDIANNTTNITKNAGDIANNASDIDNLQKGKDGMFQVSQDYNAPAPEPTGEKSAAGGAGAVASGDNSTAIGNDAKATANNSTALGNSAWASANNSVALGHGSVADRANSVSVGSVGNERQITNVAAGVAPTDAVNVSQLEALGGTVNQYFNAANKRIDKVDNNARAGIAAAMAAGTLPQSTLPGKSMVTVGASTYRGESAIALGVSRLSDNARTVIKANASADSRGNAGAAVGAGWHW